MIQPSNLVIYSSYPKTGSTFLIDLFKRWGRSHKKPDSIEFFTWMKGKHNFALNKDGQPRLICLKTHRTPDHFAKALMRYPVSVALPAADLSLIDAMRERYVYIYRNPFAVLVSAINYSKFVLLRPNELAAWIEDGTAEKYFVKFLRMPAIPSPEEFSSFSFLDLDAKRLQGILQRYVDSGCSIPFLERGGVSNYLQHIASHSFIAERSDSLSFSYESLMNRDIDLIHKMADLFSVERQELLTAWDAEAEARGVAAGKYSAGFYGTFNRTTPERIRGLKTWPQLSRQIKLACPPLAELVE